MRHDTQSPKRAAYEALRRSILLMETPPGSPLDESDLAARFGVSRTPMREVIRQLASEGYAVLVAHRGAQVSDMSHRTLRDFFLAAPMIYAAVLRLAAEEATGSEIEALKTAQVAFRAALEDDDVKARTLANDTFHRITGAMSRNPFLQPSFDRLLIDHARIGMTFFRSGGPMRQTTLDEAARQHDAMIAAIEARDGAAAEALAAAHWDLSRGEIESYVLPSGLTGGLGTVPGRAERERA